MVLAGSTIIAHAVAVIVEAIAGGHSIISVGTNDELQRLEELFAHAG